MNWKILESEQLFDDLWFKVRKDKCETPQGKIVNPYYVYEFPTWVTCFALTEDNKVVMEKQYRHAIGETCWEIPGGCVDEEDSNLEAAIKRELLEETGYEFSNYEYLGKTCANPSTNNNWMHMFLATGGKKTSEQTLDPNEEIVIELFSMEEFKRMFYNNEFIQSMHVTCMLYAMLKLGELEIKNL
ncbi:MAG TPA: NUDIX hydrolase [Niabella sp.]|nr:NUDIX hydrolase [Niabella sp.]HOZ97436.1 NUDIX hydrolase [Niabella sp.]HQW15196.1 NUDIX hydrolase [Niabella sp.]HQX20337.1 NUDIX hydrolase [Niabella sp.]HQX42168.1 NUDIX hydrolase [Niabella sp.]